MPTTRSARHLRAALLVPALAMVAGCQGSTADPSPVTAGTSAAPGEDAAATSSSADDAQVTTALALAPADALKKHSLGDLFCRISSDDSA